MNERNIVIFGTVSVLVIAALLCGTGKLTLNNETTDPYALPELKINEPFVFHSCEINTTQVGIETIHEVIFLADLDGDGLFQYYVEHFPASLVEVAFDVEVGASNWGEIAPGGKTLILHVSAPCW